MSAGEGFQANRRKKRMTQGEKRGLQAKERGGMGLSRLEKGRKAIFGVASCTKIVAGLASGRKCKEQQEFGDGKFE